MKKTVAALVAVVTMGTVAITALGADPAAKPRVANVENDPYVRLYTARLELAKVDVERYQAQLKFDSEREQMVHRIYLKGAASYEEHIDKVRRAEIARIGVRQAEVRVKEITALLDLCRFLRENGQTMPILPVEIYPVQFPSPN